VGEGHAYWSIFFQNTINKAAVGRGRIVDSCFKFVGHGRLDSILGSFSIPGINLFPHNPSKKLGSGTEGTI